MVSQPTEELMSQDLTAGCSCTQIRRAYRNLATKAHPDKGGDAELFRAIQQVLSTGWLLGVGPGVTAAAGV